MTNQTKCIEARGAPNTHGYGRIEIGGKPYGAHVISYLLFNGSIKKPLQVDHKCRNRKCINPEHLQLLTVKDNVLSGIGLASINIKKTHCRYGHEYTEENIYKQPTYPNRRICKLCVKMYSKRARDKRNFKAEGR